MRTTIVFVTVLLAAAAAVAQPPLPVLQYNAPPNFYKSAMTNPEDFSSSEVNASVQVYPFRPFAGNIQQLVGQTLLRDWIDPRYREENIASQPDFRSEIVPGAQAAFLVSFFENRVGLPRPHVRLVVAAGNAAAIVDVSANSPATLQRVAPAMNAMIKSVRVVAGVAAPPMTHGSTPANRAQAGIYMGIKQKFQVNLWGGVGSGTFTPAPHFYLFSPDGRALPHVRHPEGSPERRQRVRLRHGFTHRSGELRPVRPAGQSADHAVWRSESRNDSSAGFSRQLHRLQRDVRAAVAAYFLILGGVFHGIFHDFLFHGIFHFQAARDAVHLVAEAVARIRAISAGVATLGSTLAWAHVNPRSVHSDVVCVMPFSFISRGHQLRRFLVEDGRVVRHERADADRIVDRHQRLDARAERAVVLLAQVIRAQVRAASRPDTG